MRICIIFSFSILLNTHAGEGSTAHRVASGLMVANSVANLSSHLELLGPSAGRLGAGLGTFARAATAAVAVRPSLLPPFKCLSLLDTHPLCVAISFLFLFGLPSPLLTC